MSKSAPVSRRSRVVSLTIGNGILPSGWRSEMNRRNPIAPGPPLDHLTGEGAGPPVGWRDERTGRRALGDEVGRQRGPRLERRDASRSMSPWAPAVIGAATAATDIAASANGNRWRI